jgi:hypothetical protein
MMGFNLSFDVCTFQDTFVKVCQAGTFGVRDGVVPATMFRVTTDEYNA